ncbi:hypothetical protein [Amnibacterium endophyticum]|uniref:Uncharacterized protein n=1 Tax=Amnibacterium endophyticum TaxID=2109337 RepID=A0ABW4LF88_9MICO
MPGSDPTPSSGEPFESLGRARAAEDEPRSWGDVDGPRDEALRRDRPPHWG